MRSVIAAVLQVMLIAAPLKGIAQIAQPTTMAEAQQEWQAADAELNAMWQRCVAPETTTVQSIAALRKAQQIWIAYRDQNARAYQLSQSSREPLDDQYYIHARAIMTFSRIAELKTLFECS